MLTEDRLEQNEDTVKDKSSKRNLRAVESNGNNVSNNEMFDGDIDLSVTRKKRFRISGDNSRILELNTSDMNTIVRLNEDYPKLLKLANDVMKLKEDEANDTEDEIKQAAEIIKSIDTEMRELIDHIFDADVSEKCASDGSMYDLFNGMFRFEHIIEKLSALYGSNITKELKAISARIKKHTNKYIGK